MELSKKQIEETINKINDTEDKFNCNSIKIDLSNAVTPIDLKEIIKTK